MVYIYILTREPVTMCNDTTTSFVWISLFTRSTTIIGTTTSFTRYIILLQRTIANISCGFQNPTAQIKSCHCSHLFSTIDASLQVAVHFLSSGQHRSCSHWDDHSDDQELDVIHYREPKISREESEWLVNELRFYKWIFNGNRSVVCPVLTPKLVECLPQ